MKKKIFSFENIVISFLIIFGVSVRVLSYYRILPLWPNFAPIAALALFSGVYLKRRAAIVVPLVAMMASDFLIGLHSLILFTWGCFVLVGVIGWWVRKNKNIMTVIGGSLAGSVLFYLVTNFAVWAFTPLYERNLSGLVQCYMMAIPFFRNTVLGDLFFVGVFFGVYELVLALYRQRELAFKRVKNN